MEFDSIRPVISGLIGGAITIAYAAWWERRRSSSQRFSDEELIGNYRVVSHAANVMFFCGIAVALGMYFFKQFDSHDWRPLGLGFGGGCAGSLLCLTIMPLLTRQHIGEAYSAFALMQKVPLWLLLPVFVGGTVVFFVAALSLME